MQQRQQIGLLALQGGKLLLVEVLESGRGYYLGTVDPTDGPTSRESEEYWPKRDLAQGALSSGDWTQRTTD